MTITRRYQITGEFGAGSELLEWDTVNDGFSVSATQQKTGSYAYKCVSQYDYGRMAIAATAQVRGGFYLRHSAIQLGKPKLFAVKLGSTYLLSLFYDGTYLKLVSGGTGHSTGTQLAEVACGSVMATTATWMHCGFDVYMHATLGWFKFYVDGELVVSFDGNTTGAGSTIDVVEYGNNQTTNTWSTVSGGTGTFYDDVYLDDTTGETIPNTPPAFSFTYHPVISSGPTNQWYGSDGNSTDNHELVDEIPHDGDTTYVMADEADLRELYGIATYTKPTGHVIAAVHPVALVRKTDASTATTLSPVVQKSGDTVVGAAQNLATMIAVVSERMTKQPDTVTAWTEAAINASKYGFDSAGNYA